MQLLVKNNTFETFRGLKKIIWGVTILTVVLELILYPGLDNFWLCLLSILCFFQYSMVVSQKRFLTHPFSTLAYTTMLAFRFLPVFATFIEGKPVALKFVDAFAVAIGEFVLFTVATLAYQWNVKSSNKHSPNVLQRFYKRINLFKRWEVYDYWLFGFVGFFFMFIARFVGTELGRLFDFAAILRFTPLLLMFPQLSGVRYADKRKVILYLILMTFLSLMTGSREALLHPIGTVILLYILNQAYTKQSIWGNLSRSQIVMACLCLVIAINIADKVSQAMLLSRSIRFQKGISIEVVDAIIDNLGNKDAIAKLEKRHSDAIEEFTFDKWSEGYLNNTLLARFCNIRLTDQTLQRAERIGYGNIDMQRNLWKTVSLFLPSPMYRLFGVSVDKSELYFSRGDYLLALSSGNAIFPSAVVTTHLADGLATFGYAYFLIQLILWFFVFRLMDSLVLIDKHGIHYSLIGLMMVFSLFGYARAAGGCTQDIMYCIRNFWNIIIGWYLAKSIVLLLKKQL